MKLPKIKTNLSVKEQLDKVNEEILEMNNEFLEISNLIEMNRKIPAATIMCFTFEILDSMTALYNLYEKAKKNGLITNEDEWITKMLEYEKTKGYEIEKWVEIDG